MANDDLSKNDLAPDVKDDIENEDRLVDESNLDDLISQATLQYSLKNREGAAELYARATELQAEKNGEMSPDNADLLYAYGRCLYHLAVEKSDVLGTKVAGEKPIREKDHTRTSLSEHDSQATNNQITEDVVKTNIPTVSKDAQAPPVLKGEAEKASEPYFQFTGDENFDTSDEEDDQEEANEDPEAYADEEDDFANAYEILDMARVLLMRQVEQLESNDSHSSDQSVILRIRGLQERLADTYDLQAEISLEGERFSDAVVDLQSALGWKTRLFPLQSSLLAEAHYKLSLALEFASINRQPTGEAEANDNQVTAVDHGMRAEAAAEMEAAIRSCKLRISLEETELQKTKQTIEKAIGAVDSKNIGDVKEMVTEMELRVSLEEYDHPHHP